MDPNNMMAMEPYDNVQSQSRNSNMSQSPVRYGSKYSQAGKDTWLRQTLLSNIVAYNKTMKGINIGRSLMGTSSAALKAKRREVIKNALISLLPDNYQRITGVPIEEAGITRALGSFYQTGMNKTLGQQRGNEIGSSFGSTLGYNQTQRYGGKIKRRGTRKNGKARKTRKNKRM